MTTSPPAEPWQDIARRKRASREAAIPARWRIPASLLPPPEQDAVQDFPVRSGFFTQQELDMTAASASEVVARIAVREWSSSEVTAAVCKRAAVAQQLLNCATEILFEQAAARARELDEHLRREKRVVGPLHGLPVSLKDQFDVGGAASTIGYASRADHRAAEDAVLVSLLLQAGAVLYVKTNVPTSLMMGETANNIFGRTLNPYNRTLTPGGSSGGEAALVAFRGSPLGVGTDIGGSVRHPASYTGLWALRPSHGRVPLSGAATSMAGQEAVRSTAGPMARAPRDLRLFCQALAAQRPWLDDPAVLPLPWRGAEEVLPSKLCFGFALGDGYVSPSPPMRRAMLLVREGLRAAGHGVVDFAPHENREAHALLQQCWTADGGEEVRAEAEASGEPLPRAVEEWIGETAVRKGLRPRTVLQMWGTQAARTELAQRWLRRWESTVTATGTGRPIDGLLIPSTPAPAPRHGGALPWQYGFLPPLLDLTSAVFPVTTVDRELDRVPADFTPLSRKDERMMTFYGGPEKFDGAPVGLQLIARRLEEEKTIAMLTLLQEVVGSEPASPRRKPFAPKLS